MDTVFPPLTATRFDAVTSAVSAAVYLLVALAALLRAPRDSRTGVFLLVAVTGLAPYLLPAYAWFRPGAFTKPVVSVLAVFVIARHAPNIRRLVRHQEMDFGAGSTS